MEFLCARTMPTTDRASARPLYVNNCGYYCDIDRERHTRRPAGRQDFMLLFVVHGSVYRPDLNQTFSDNTVMLFRPHRLQDYAYQPADGHTLYYFLHFSGQVAPNYVDEHFPDLASVDLAPVVPHLREMIRELRTHPPGFEVRCAGLLLCILSEIPRRIHHSDDSAAQLAEWINTHYTEPLPAACTVRSTVRRFQKYTGHTPTQYMQQLRLSEGARRLLETDEPVSAVAEAVGYEDPLYFSRLFRRRYGKSPVEYRASE